jgi:ergothioneine biosynthesis protein EgtB
MHTEHREKSMMPNREEKPGREERDLAAEYLRVRNDTEEICVPLTAEDCQIQSIIETSPPKWHLAHVTWFFETFLLQPFLPGYRAFHPRFGYLFNSYYETVGSMHPRPRRGLLARPTLAEVMDYRAHVDRHMGTLLGNGSAYERDGLLGRLELGLNHEQQHQELLFMDIKHNFFVNPLLPAYREDLHRAPDEGRPMGWIEQPGGLREIGAPGTGFAFDNETPRHEVLLRDHRIADRLVTNGEFLAFVEDDGYRRPELWLADGWQRIRAEDWRHPLYWIPDESGWQEFTLGGPGPLARHEPVAHLSYYEADAYARWAGKRLPLEEELECALAAHPRSGKFADSAMLHPAPAGPAGQWYGDLWNWTASAYGAYPGFRPLEGSMGEYNGKFMSNQMVLRAGSCATPAGHVRESYRNFFYPHDRWAFSGLRLAEDP